MRTLKEEVELRIKEAKEEVQRLEDKLASIPAELHNVELQWLTRLHDFFFYPRKSDIDVKSDTPNPGDENGNR